MAMKRGGRKGSTWDPMKEHYDRENIERVFVSLYVSNIPDKLDQNGLRNLFLKYGNVRGVRILPKNYNTQKFAGFVNYDTLEEAQKAIQELDRREPFQLNVKLKRTERSSDFSSRFSAACGDTNDLLPGLDDLDADIDSDDDPLKTQHSLTGRVTLNKGRSISAGFLNGRPNFRGSKESFRHPGELLRELTGRKNEQQSERSLLGMGRGIKNVSKVEESTQAKISGFFGSIGRGISTKVIIEQSNAAENLQEDGSSSEVLPGAKELLNSHQVENDAMNVRGEKENVTAKGGPMSELNITKSLTKQEYEDSPMDKSDEMDKLPTVDSLELELEQQVNVIVSQIDSLNFIWVQLYDNVMGEIKCLEDSLKSDNSKNVTVDHIPKIGGVYLVHFSGNKFHRAKITDINIDKSYCVLYIDYGNVQTNIKRRDVKLLSQSSLKYPAQAIKCKMYSTAKKRFATVTEFANALLGNAVRICVRQFEDNIPVVDFIENAVPDIADTDKVKTDETASELVPEDKTCNAPEKDEITPALTKEIEVPVEDSEHQELTTDDKTSDSDDDKITDSDIDWCSTLNYLDMDDELSLKWINSSFRLHFWAQALPRETETSCKQILELHTLAEDKWTTYLDLSSVNRGDLVAAKSEDGCYYRAVILNIEGPKCRVFFIDYGKEEDVTDLKKIRREYKSKPSLAVICAVSEEAVDADFQKYLEENRLRVSEKKTDGVKAMLNCNTQSVSIAIEPWFNKFNLQGLKKNIQTPIQTSTRTTVSALKKPELPEENYSSVLVVNVNGADNITVHVEKVFQTDSVLSELLNSGLMATSNVPYNGNVGELVCAKSQLDSYWYRAEILNIKKPHATVLYVDFGNREDVPLTRIKPIPDEALKFEKLSLTVALEKSPDSLQPLEQVINKKLITMKIIDRNLDPIRVEFFKDDEPLFPASNTVQDKPSFTDVEEKPVEPIPTAAKNQVTKMKMLNDMKCSTLPLGRVDVAVTYVQSPEMIFCIRTCDHQISAWATLSEAVNEYGRTVPQKSHVPLLGEVCVVFYKGDGAWYRAVCLDIQQKYLMFFIDFGITDEILPLNIRPITEELFQYPIMIAHCKLMDYKSVEWDAEDMERVKAIIPAGSAMTIEVVSYDISDCVDYVYWIKLV